MLVHRDRRSPLSGVAVLSGCSARDLERIDRACVELEVPRGRVLCREGEIGRECFVIVHGEAAVTVAGSEVARLGDGSFFGEIAVLDGGTRTASVTAATPMHLLVFTSGEFHAVLRDVPILARNVMATLGSRLRLADRALTAARQDVELLLITQTT